MALNGGMAVWVDSIRLKGSQGLCAIDGHNSVHAICVPEKRSCRSGRSNGKPFSSETQRFACSDLRLHSREPLQSDEERTVHIPRIIEPEAGI